MKGKISAFAALFITLPALLFAWGGGGCGLGDQYGHMGHRFFGGFYGGGLIMGIVTLVLLGLLIFFGVKYFKNGGQLNSITESPINILKTRYAKGEITKEEFEAMKKDLNNN